MLEIVYQFTYLALSAAFIAGVWWGTLRLMDRALGIDFKQEFRELAGDNIALSIYFVGRLIALAILFAPLLRVIL